MDTSAEEALTEDTTLPFTVTKLSQVWALDSDLVLAADGRDLYLLDLQAPPASSPRDHTTFPGEITALTAVGTTAYAGSSDGSLFVLDAGEDAGLALLASEDFSATVSALLAQPPFLFQQSGADTIHILDIHDPVRPQPLASYQTPTSVLSFDLGGSTLYLGVQGQGIQVLDLSDAAHPRLVTTIPTPTDVQHLATDGDWLIAWEAGRGFEVFSLSDPQHPTFEFFQPNNFDVDQLILQEGRLTSLSRNERVRQYLLSPDSFQLTPLDTQLYPAGAARQMQRKDDTLWVATAAAGVQRYHSQYLWLPLQMLVGKK
ncbi:MAG: hypothetical protein GXP38_02170 [Chloroflexi bacterium]|nr:hypothetical protein [Chloroflexota bacterium]